MAHLMWYTIQFLNLYLFLKHATFPPEILVWSNIITDEWTQSVYNENRTTSLYCNLNVLEYNEIEKTQQNPCRRKPIAGKEKIYRNLYGDFDRGNTRAYLLVVKTTKYKTVLSQVNSLQP
jgi:hypothetical protein